MSIKQNLSNIDNSIIQLENSNMDSISIISEREEYASPTKGEFPIIAQDSLPRALIEIILKNSEGVKYKDSDALSLVEYYRSSFSKICDKLIEAGFNCVLSELDGKITPTFVEECANKNIKAILSLRGYLASSTTQMVNAISKFSNYSNVTGWEIWDEPQFNHIGDYQFAIQHPDMGYSELEFNQVSFGFGLAKTILKNSLYYFNLAVPELKNRPVKYDPIYWEITGSYNNYRDYLEAIDKLYQPMVWSYDVYPFIIHGTNTEIETLYQHFYESLDIIVNKANETKKPFWAYCECISHKVYNNNELYYTRPIPTLGELRFEAFSALALGAQGLVFWQVADGPDGMVYREQQAPITCTLRSLDTPIVFGTNSEPQSITNSTLNSYANSIEKYRCTIKVNDAIFTAVKELIKEIRTYEDIFLNCKLNSYGHSMTQFENCPSINYPLGCIEYLSGDVLASWISTGQEDYLIIVSHNPFDSISLDCYFTANANIEEVAIAGKFQYSVITPISQQLSKFILEPGGYVILKWNR